MSGAKEIRVKIGSIKNTQKITSAMEMVAASKMKKAQDTMAASQPYSRKIRDVISHIACANAEFTHPYMQTAEQVERVGFVIVSSDRGLCGGLNNNLFRSVIKDVKAYQDKDIGIDLCLVGRKAVSFFRKVGGNVVATADQVGDKPTLTDLIGIMKTMLDKFDSGEIQKLYLCSNEFVNTMVQKPTIHQLLPLEKDETVSQDQGHWDYIYEPDDARELLTLLLKRYIESQVYQAVIENIACFQAAQMVAMKSATENAGELINELQLIYNKARQASITREISEIVGGADAID